MTKLEKHGKGIILMHDFQHATAEALPELTSQLKAGGYKVVTWCRGNRSRHFPNTTKWLRTRTNCRRTIHGPRPASCAPSANSRLVFSCLEMMQPDTDVAASQLSLGKTHRRGSV